MNWPVIKATLLDEFVIAHTLGGATLRARHAGRCCDAAAT
jgi:hypothetical protein